MSVYFVVCEEAGAVKIGTSLDPRDRLRELQRGCPLPLRLAAILPGNHQEEGAFHQRFVEDRLHGEWFRLTALIQSIIAANPPPPPMSEKERKAQQRMARAANKPMSARELANDRDRKFARYAERALRDQQRETDRMLARKVAAGDIHYPFRGTGA